ncbi:MAG TPA: cytochrome c-type biogenesis protein [Rhizomicrobium sp.]
MSLQTAFAAPPPERLADPALEARAVSLQKELRCLVCQGQSLDESGAPLAADLRRLIRQHIAAGESDEQVKRYLVARYGDFILMKPPLERDTLFLWFGPALVLLFGAGVATIVIYRASKRPEARPR